jgi:hypothetical protein
MVVSWSASFSRCLSWSEVVAVLAAVALIQTLQVKAFESIQLAPTLAAIAGGGPQHH